jgi:hypothetical protein
MLVVHPPPQPVGQSAPTSFIFSFKPCKSNISSPQPFCAFHNLTSFNIRSYTLVWPSLNLSCDVLAIPRTQCERLLLVLAKNGSPTAGWTTHLKSPNTSVRGPALEMEPRVQCRQERDMFLRLTASLQECGESRLFPSRSQYRSTRAQWYPLHCQQTARQ